MRATELMIGDWVLDVSGKERICQVQAIGNGKLSVTYADNSMNSLKPMAMFQPIPLTAEILNKNGFVQNNSHRMLYVHINDYNGYAFSLDADNVGWHLTANKFISIDSVHELQHALRLCGIEKEIVL